MRKLPMACIEPAPLAGLRARCEHSLDGGGCRRRAGDRVPTCLAAGECPPFRPLMDPGNALLVGIRDLGLAL